MLTEFLSLALANSLLILFLFFCVWVVSVVTRDSSIADIFWGLGFVVVVWFTWAISDGVEERRLLVAVLTTIWGVRLGAYIGWRNWGVEDPRYARFREHIESQGKNFAIHSLIHVYLLQGVFMCLTALVLIFAMSMDTPEQLGWLAWAGTALWVVGMIFEVVGDAQLARFKADPANEGKILDHGLWRYTRHPNYFGEACIWVGFFLIAAENPLGLITIISPITIIYAVAGPSGKALLERRMSKKRPDFEDYKRRTSGFFPLPPKKQT